MQKILLFFLLGLLSLCVSFAQKQATIDSLNAVLKATTQDTARIHISNALAKEYQKTKPEKAMEYAQQALKMAEALLPFTKIDDKLNGQKIENRIKKGMADAIYIMAQIYDHEGNYDLALKNYFRSLDIRQKIEDKKGISFSYNGIGLVYQDQGKYEDALKMYNKSLEVKKSIGDKKGIANSYVNIGRIYERQGNYIDALKMQFSSLKIKQEIGDKRGTASNYLNIASVYRQQKNYEEALKMQFQAMQIMEAEKDKSGMMLCYNDIGVIYMEQDKYDDALKYYIQSSKIAEEIGNKYVLAIVNSNVGNIYREKKNYKDAEKYNLSGLKASKESGHKEAVITIHTALGDLYQRQGKYKLSLEHFNEALMLSKTAGMKNLIRDSYGGLTMVYEKMNDYQKAFESHQLYTQLNDTMLNEISIKQINELKTKYETEKKEKEIELLNKDKKLKEIQFQADIQEQTTLRNVFIGGFILVLLLALVSIIGYRQKIRSNAIIALKNEEISRQKANITGQEEERKRIAQELHDGIGGTLAGIKLNLVRINSSPNNVPELESVIINIGDACKEIRTISHNLAPPSLSNISLIEIMKDLIKKFEVPGKMDIRFEYFPEEEINQIPVNIHADIYRITQELLHNIVKHAKANTIEIDLSKEGNYLYLLVEDNGIGFDITAAQKGIGLQNIESRVNLLNGKMVIDSKIGRGTAMNIHIPITGKSTNTTFT